jgi:hypothetical protein
MRFCLWEEEFIYIFKYVTVLDDASGSRIAMKQDATDKLVLKRD